MRLQAAIAALALSAAAWTSSVQIPETWTRPVAPFRVIDNIYYVGTEDLASYLIATPNGHILIDTGLEQNAQVVLEGIRTLGFKAEDVQMLLTTQAHFDHVGAHARVSQATGALVMASAADAMLLEDGGKSDYHFGPSYHFRPVPVFTTVTDGQAIRIGSATLVAHLTPGHTPGTTTWTMPVKDRAGKPRQVVFLASTAVNEGVRLVNNEKYPRIAEDFARSFEVQKSLPCEVFLAAHMVSFGGLAKAAAAAAGKGEDAFIDPEGCRTAIERSERAFNEELARQKKEDPPRL
jgi:metallo-beta-lactamase class B